MFCLQVRKKTSNWRLTFSYLASLFKIVINRYTNRADVGAKLELFCGLMTPFGDQSSALSKWISLDLTGTLITPVLRRLVLRQFFLQVLNKDVR